MFLSSPAVALSLSLSHSHSRILSRSTDTSCIEETQCDEDEVTEPVCEWSVDKVCTWLDQIKVKEEVVSAFRCQDISGRTLKPEKLARLWDTLPTISFGQRDLIMEELDKLLKSEPQTEQTPCTEETVAARGSERKLPETFRKFDTEADMTVMYKTSQSISTSTHETKQPP